MIKNNEITDIEEWRDVVSFEGMYQVSSHGRVKSLTRISAKKPVLEKIMVLHPDNGYLSVWLRRPGGIHKKCRIHRVVAVAFLPRPAGPTDELIVNHKDRDRHNNHVSNLEWMTQGENVKHWQEDDKAKKAEYATAADIPF